MNQIEKNYKSIKDKHALSQPHERELNELILSLEKTMYKIIDSFNIVDADLKEDLMQEGRLAVCKAVASFSNDQDASFYTFAYQCIKNGMLDYLRKRNSKKNVAISQAVPLDKINESELEDPNLDIEEFFDNKDKINNMMDQLDDVERKIVLMQIDGYSYEEMAQQLGKKTKDIDNIIQKIRRKFKTI